MPIAFRSAFPARSTAFDSRIVRPDCRRGRRPDSRIVGTCKRIVTTTFDVQSLQLRSSRARYARQLVIVTGFKCILISKAFLFPHAVENSINQAKLSFFIDDGCSGCPSCCIARSRADFPVDQFPRRSGKRDRIAQSSAAFLRPSAARQSRPRRYRAVRFRGIGAT